MSTDILDGFDLLLEAIKEERNRMANTMPPLVSAGRTSEARAILDKIVSMDNLVPQVSALRNAFRLLFDGKPILATDAKTRQVSGESDSTNSEPGTHRRVQRSGKIAHRRLAEPRRQIQCTPETAFREPLIIALGSMGGRASASKAVEGVGRMLKDLLTDDDRRPTRSGAVRWENRVQWVRLHLKEEGLIRSDSPTGTWELSEAGWRRYHELQAGLALESPPRQADVPASS